MRRLGTLLHITTRGSLIVRTSKTPPIGGIVLTSNAEKIGKIVDVFGPVKEPYVAIRPFKRMGDTHDRAHPKTTVSEPITAGAVLYVSSRPEKPQKARKRKR
ncbi:MAG: Gar1/Naf1 family protein [Candidatus Thorarchaeota archaeon]|nr:Gar1/Naf1 family protein [Candidatus Thorarchaeota archaeon]